MARKNWDELSDKYRKRLESKGITKAHHNSGASVQGARGHAKTPERPSRAKTNPLKYGEYIFVNQNAEEEDGDFTPLTYEPTNTTWPENGYDHRRTTAAGYNPNNGKLRIEFYTDGSVYDYGTTRRIPKAVALAFRRTESPGKFINSTLNRYGYGRIG
jgi:KTSC domain